MVHFRVWIEGDQLIDQVAVDLLQYVRFIDSRLVSIFIRCIADLHNDSSIVRLAAITAKMFLLHRDVLDL